MKAGDRVFVYHTGDEKAAVGDGRGGARGLPRSEVAATRSSWSWTSRRSGGSPRPVTLAEIKALAVFADSPLVRQGRLSVVPLTAAQWKAIESQARE